MKRQLMFTAVLIFESLCGVVFQYSFVRDMMDNVPGMSNFFNNSPKRTQILTRIIKEVSRKNCQVKLLNVCHTRMGGTNLWFKNLQELRLGYIKSV